MTNREAQYLEARGTAWAQFHAVTGDAGTAYLDGKISRPQLLIIHNAALATLDDAMTAARKAAGYQR